MPTKTGKKKSAWSAKDIYDMFVKSYEFTNVKSREIRKAEADKYTIPYIPEKEIMLTTGRYNTGKISTNVLDSIYNAAKRTNVPVDIALGLAGRESTLGVGRGFKRGQSISGIDLMSNWQQIQPVVYKDSERNRWNETVRKEKSGQQLNEQDYLDRLDFLIKNQEAIESTKPLNENPIDNALKLYQSGKYNPGDKRHTQMVEEDAKVLMSDPAIQKWLKSKGDNQMKCGGRRKAELGLAVTDGGTLTPIAPNMYLAQGRTHDDGGIGISYGKKYNAGGNLEIEDKEILQIVGDNTKFVGNGKFKGGGQEASIRVFSSVPFLRGVSPAELVLRGANPNAVFKAQEEFKDRNRINDDGTTYEMGGEGKVKSKHSRPVTGVLPYAYTIRNLYAVENPYRKGIKGNVAKMYDSRTLGAGVDVVSGHPELYKKAKSGKMTKKQADETAVIHLRKDDNAIRNNYADVYGKAAADTLSYGPRFLVAQARYQQGNVRKAWQPIHKAMAKGDAKALKKAVLQVTPKDHTYRRKWIEDFKVYKMGGMIYEINGNVKNGLMNARPKAKYGTIKRHGKTWKWDEENGAYVPVKDSKEKEPINVNKQTNSSISNDKKQKYTINGTFDNARPQYYAKKRLPIAGGKSIAEKAGLARSGWSYADSPTINYVPNINLTIPENYGKGVASSTPRGRVTKASTPKAASKSTPTIQDTVNKITADALKASKTPKIDLDKVEMPKFDINRLKSKKTKEDKAKLNTFSTGGGTQSKDERLIPQFKPINTGDWIGLGSNLAGHIASYFINNNMLKKYPMPAKPVPFQAAKLKTTHNINPDLANINEVSQMNIAEVGRNTASSNTSIARKQRIMNEARDARNKLYGQKENIETQLINLDRRNRQDVYNRNIAAYNDWLDKTYVAKNNKILDKQRNLMHMITGIPSAVNYMLGNIENRKSTNNTLRAIAAANPNVDGRLLGIGDYYVGEKTKKKYDKFGNLID